MEGVANKLRKIKSNYSEDKYGYAEGRYKIYDSYGWSSTIGFLEVQGIFEVLKLLIPKFSFEHAKKGDIKRLVYWSRQLLLIFQKVVDHNLIKKLEDKDYTKEHLKRLFEAITVEMNIGFNHQMNGYSYPKTEYRAKYCSIEIYKILSSIMAINKFTQFK